MSEFPFTVTWSVLPYLGTLSGFTQLYRMWDIPWMTSTFYKSYARTDLLWCQCSRLVNAVYVVLRDTAIGHTALFTISSDSHAIHQPFLLLANNLTLLEHCKLLSHPSSKTFFLLFRIVHFSHWFLQSQHQTPLHHSPHTIDFLFDHWITSFSIFTISTTFQYSTFYPVCDFLYYLYAIRTTHHHWRLAFIRFSHLTATFHNPNHFTDPSQVSVTAMIHIFLNTANQSDVLGVVTSMVPGLFASSSAIPFSSTTAVTSVVEYSLVSSSIYSLGSFGKVVGDSSESSTIVFGLSVQ